jgi:uncharacterized paraquat-inducible protein A
MDAHWHRSERTVLPITYRSYIDCPECLDPFMASWSSAKDAEATVCPRCGHAFLSAFPGFTFTPEVRV